MVVAAIAMCAGSLGAGFIARWRLARDMAVQAQAERIAVPHAWLPVARTLLRRDRAVMGLAVWLMLVDTALSLAAPWPLKLVVDHGLGHQRYPGWLAGLRGLSPVGLAAAAAAGGLVLLALGAVAAYLVTYLTGAVGERMVARLRTGVIDHIVRVAPRDAARFPLGELTSRVSADAARVADVVTDVIGTVIPDLATLAGMTTITAFLDWRLTLVVLGVIPLYALTARQRNRVVRPAQQQARARSGDLEAQAAGLLARLPAVHVFGRADTEVARYGQASLRAASASVAALDASARFMPATDILPGIGVSAALLAGTVEVSSGRLTVGGLLVFLAYLSSLTAPVRSLARVSATVARGSASKDRVGELLIVPALEPAARRLPRARRTAASVSALGARAGGDHGRPGLAVSLAGVTYSPRPGHGLLTAASLDVGAGECVCITGPSGAGKSTLLSLLVRLADPQSGSIAIDGQDIAALPLGELLRLVTLVPQDPWLHAGTIADNIGYGRPGASRAQILAAARVSGVCSFARALADGLDTAVGEHGRRLSGGQQRRVALARALLRDTPVLLLDEPTTGLDPGTESRVVAGLLSATRGKTVILVTHQPRLAVQADRTVALENGRITASAAGPARMAEPGRPPGAEITACYRGHKHASLECH
jgi:ABC-type multidrug transport system fused ATPase/permease subunit